MSTLRPMHKSFRDGRRAKNRSIDSLEVTDAQRIAIQEVALDIFTDMSNDGFNLQETLAAVYMSGIMHALEMTKKGKVGDEE